MKRVIGELTSTECDAAFSCLGVVEKRRALESISDGNTIQVHRDTNLFRDVVTVMAPYLDIQTWGRLRSTCKTFNLALEVHPHVREIRAMLEHGGTLDADTLRPLVTPMHRAYLFRMLLDIRSAFGDMDIQAEFMSARQFYTMTRKWYNIPFSGGKVLFPWGYICNSAGKPVGNIFRDQIWDSAFPQRGMFGCIHFKLYHDLDPEQRAYRDRLKHQLKSLKSRG